MRGEVQTIDEGVHLVAGITYWQTRDFRLNEEHPPLVKLLAAIPVLLAQPNIPYDRPAWREGNQWAFARDVLYESGNDADQLLFLGRLVMVAFSLGLGLMLYLWGTKLAGFLGGLCTLGWFAFDPNFLAHGRYITTDVPITLAYLATLYLLVRLTERWTMQRLLSLGVVFGLAQMTKFSATFLLFVVAAVIGIVVYKQRTSIRRTLQKVGIVIAVCLGGTVAAAMLCYFGQVRTGQNDPWVQALLAERERVVTSQQVADQPAAVQRIISLTDPQTTSGRIIRTLVLKTPIPAWSYVKGFAVVLNHEYWGHLAYLNGMYSNFGWWWYFPFALLVKLPAATLTMLLVAVAAILQARLVQGQRFQRAFHILAWSAVAYFVWSMSGNLNLGIRHVFPAYVVLFPIIGACLASIIRSQNQLLRIVVWSIAGLYLVTSALAYPHYTAYFSEFAGGTTRGASYLVDSNLDWGQDLKHLAKYMQAHDIPHVCMSYFGQASPSYYGIDHRYLPSVNDPHEPREVNCVVAISVTSFLSRDGAYWWLKTYVPDARIGGSIHIYDFRDGRVPTLAH